MKKIKSTFLLSLYVLVLAWLTPESVLGNEFTAIYVFGDSLSDNGNLKSTDPTPFQSPYLADGRFTNGPVAVEQLAEHLDLALDPATERGANYAFAGATAGGATAIDLTAQVQTFLATNSEVPQHALYIVFIGGNDVLEATFGALEPHETVGIIRDGVDSILANTRDIIEAGARAVMVVGVPNLGRLPATNETVLVSKRATLNSVRFNERLARGIEDLEKELGIDIVFFDLFRFLEQLPANLRALGFTNSDEPCLTRTGELDTNSACASNEGRPEPLFDQSVWFDPIHPTARVHERIGRAFFTLIPVPNTGALELTMSTR